MQSHDTLVALIEAEWERPLAARVVALGAELAARARGGAAAVLFYGSALRDQALDGVLDFYVLTDDSRDWPASRLVSLAGRWLPPNVGYVESSIEGQTLRAKYAVMTVRQFRDAMSARSIDTTVWARFSQPCACVVSRSEADRAEVLDAVVDAVVTAARWAAVLGPERGDAADYWRALFTRTYAVELRVERSTRGADLIGADIERYRRLLPVAWTECGLSYEATPEGVLAPSIDARQRRSSERRWRRLQRLGRPLNLLRLLKAAPTFDNAADYVAWKIERHSGYRIEPSAFQRRHPLLSAPGLYLRLKRKKVIR